MRMLCYSNMNVYTPASSSSSLSSLVRLDASSLNNRFKCGDRGLFLDDALLRIDVFFLGSADKVGDSLDNSLRGLSVIVCEFKRPLFLHCLLGGIPPGKAGWISDGLPVRGCGLYFGEMSGFREMSGFGEMSGLGEKAGFRGTLGFGEVLGLGDIEGGALK